MVPIGQRYNLMIVIGQSKRCNLLISTSASYYFKPVKQPCFFSINSSFGAISKVARDNL